MSPDINQLTHPSQIKLLMMISETGSFSGAAARLGVSQPSVSQQVSRLETLTGRILFRRSRKGVGLTADGEAVLIYARAMSALTDDLRRQLHPGGTRISISVGMAGDFCRTALPRVLRLFMSDHPEVEIRILTGTYTELNEALRAGSVDFAVMRRYFETAGAVTFWTDELIWVGRTGLDGPIADPIPLALPVGPNPGRDIVFNALRSAGRTWRVVFEGHSLIDVEAALQAGIGVYVAPRRMVLYDVSPVPVNSGLPPLPDAEFVLVTGSGGGLSGTAQAFIEVMRQAAASSFQL